MELNDLEDVRVDERDGVLYVTLDRPEARNALSQTIVESLLRVADYVVANKGRLRALVLRGAGGVFCAGGDLKGFQSLIVDGQVDADAIAAGNRRGGVFYDALDRLPVTVIAAVEGAAMGGGIGLAAVADVAIATVDTKFSLTETTLGLLPAQVGPCVIARIGAHQARRLMLTAARIDAAEAARLLLIDAVVQDSDALDAAVEATLQRVRRCAPGANAVTKALVHAAADVPLGELRDQCAQRFAETMLGPEAREGVGAFLNRRNPAWASEQEVSA